MMTTSSTSLFGGLVGLVIVVAILALVAGAALSGSDLLNPNTSAANAEAITHATESKSEKEALDRRLLEAQVEAEEKRIRQETVARQRESDRAFALAVQLQKHELDRIHQEAVAQQRESEQALGLAAQRQQHELEQEERRNQVINSVLPAMAVSVIMAVLIISGGLTYYLVRSGRSRGGMAEAQLPTRTPNVDPWHDPAWRAEQINIARVNEVARRWAKLARQAASRSASGGHGGPPSTKESARDTTGGTKL